MNWLARLGQIIWGSRTALPQVALAVVPVDARRVADVSRHDRGIIDHSRHVSSIGRR